MTRQTKVKMTDGHETLRQYLLIVFAVGCAGMGVLRAMGFESMDLDVLWFFAVAGVLLMLDRIREFAVGKDGVSAKLADLEQKMDEIEDIAVDAAQNVAGTVQLPAATARAATPSLEGVTLPPATVANDPQKGRFGGKAEMNGRRLSADVRESSVSPRYFDIFLHVESVDAKKPLTGLVTFYLHDSFRRPVRAVEVQNGVVDLQLLAYGAFTVGVVADDGKTLLELDLAEDMRFPKRFREL